MNSVARARNGDDMAVIHSLTWQSLLLKSCPDCKEVTVHGFHHQVEWVQCDCGQYYVSVCKHCGHEDKVTYAPSHEPLFANGLGI